MSCAEFVPVWLMANVQVFVPKQSAPCSGKQKAMAHISEQLVWYLFAKMVAFLQILHKNMLKQYHFSTKNWKLL